MRKTTIFTLTLLSLAILPAMAQVNTGLGQVWDDIQSYSADMGKYLQNNQSENLKPVEAQSRNALDSSKGDTELKIPNPVTAGQKVRDNIINESYRSQSKESRFENNAAVRANLVSNELNRFITRGAAEAILGKDGQNRTQAKLENTQNTLEEINAISDTAGAKNNLFSSKFEQLTRRIETASTTDVTKLAATGTLSGLQNLAQILGDNHLETIKIQRAQSAIIGETFAQTMQTNQSLQYSNLNLANISQQAEEANRARRVDTSTEAARLLRATSQLDLFGREGLDKCGMNLQLKPLEMQIRDKLCQVIR
ncbi:hypothetical protein [Nostoc sphaeroides]|uniref:Uncharacterized protein n=1 Tax=Nostoc sphaeroides CCNUC1 TaxID=2653204 RepID=A0A5P8W4Q6_9NOSO|nr:hypothetical protein [Nostoc sphaeroides]MCC5631284.1 hypothetical protein [Nostoc sphaeroides CHAB 2801]QFS47491.1 hypothetical protein GXM_04983 [Nostoc sphaeroides CCNUC1]